MIHKQDGIAINKLLEETSQHDAQLLSGLCYDTCAHELYRKSI